MHPDLELLMRLLLALLWGGVVGAEREYRSKSAGFRTMILIAVGSCLFTLLSGYIGGPGNPDRIAANIVTGIGFLGAGVIFKGTDTHINGVTTAATIWAVAAIGMALGAGHYWGACCGAALLLLVLALLPYLERRIGSYSQFRTYTVQYSVGHDMHLGLAARLQAYGLRYRYHSLSRDGQMLTLRFEVQGRAAGHQALTEALISDAQVIRFDN